MLKHEGFYDSFVQKTALKYFLTEDYSYLPNNRAGWIFSPQKNIYVRSYDHPSNRTGKDYFGYYSEVPN